MCPGTGNISLSLDDGTPGTGALVQWYTDAGLTNNAGSGDPLVIPAPMSTTTYYGRYEGDCNNTAAANVTVTVKTESVAPTSAGSTPESVCLGQVANIDLSCSGHTLGHGAQVQWASNISFTPVLGMGTPFNHSAPTVTTTYFARVNGDCNTTSHTSVQVEVFPSPAVFDLSGSTITQFGLDDSETGVEYTLYRSGTAVVTVAGTGAAIVFGNFTKPGLYLAKGRNTTNLCEVEMAYTINIPGAGSGMDGMFVLDVSGSMGRKADPDCPADCTPKIEVLRNSVIKTTNYWLGWNLLNPADDKTGVTLFNGTATPSSFNGGYALIDVNTTNIGTINTYVGNLSDGGSTSMGAGLLSAIADLTDATRRRNIILFTDGEQNTGPMVVKTSTGSGPMDYNLSINSTILDDQIKIFPIGITAPVPQFMLLEDIARKTHGAAYLTYLIEDDLTEPMIHSLVMAMKDLCPQLVTSKKGVISGSEANEGVSLDNYKHNIAFLVNGFSPENTGLTAEIFKGGLNLTDHATLTDLGHFKAFLMQLPVIHEGQLIHSGGTWDIKISGSDGQKYGLHVIVDEYQLDYECEILPSQRNSGDPIELAADLSFLGQPLFNNISVMAYVARPGADLGTIMSTRSIKDLIESRQYILREDARYIAKIPIEAYASEAYTPADLKRHHLLENIDVLQLLQSIQSRVTLTHEGNGHFTGSFDNTDVTGPYQVLFKISGELPGLGSFQRIELHSTVRGFGTPDPGSSGNIYVPPCLCVPARVIMRPVNTFNQFLGPGYAKMIQAEMGGAQPTRIIDNLDGSYTLVFKGQKPDPDTRVITTIAGKPFYSGTVSGISIDLPDEAKILKRRARIMKKY